jgi:hypothetical protein
MIDSKTGFFNPPQASCIKGEGLLCPIREKPDSQFSCLPEDCKLARKVETSKNKQEKLV